LRLQLIGLLWALLTVLVVVFSSARARAEGVEGKLVSEVGGYQDTTSTSVLTPSLGAGVTWPDAGIELEGGYLVDVVSTASPDVVATASPRWEEVRHGAHLGFRYKPDRYGFSLRAAASPLPQLSIVWIRWAPARS
jgi:hypothetical protein